MLKRLVVSIGYFLLGIPFLILAWAKHVSMGFTTPTQHNSDDAKVAALYAIHIYSVWKQYLGDDFVAGKRVLELCPGNSLGIGALALADGALSFQAVDAFNLVRDANTQAVIDLGIPEESTRTKVRTVVADANRFSFAVDQNFDLPAVLQGKKYDVIFSCASFEHFDDVEAVIVGLSKLAAPKCVTAHIVDFQTHTRWIRERDPNNIYRYPNWLYKTLGYPGQPNRRRPKEYVAAFTRTGWDNPHFVSTKTVPANAHHFIGLDRQFGDDPDDLEIINGVLVAQRPM